MSSPAASSTPRSAARRGSRRPSGPLAALLLAALFGTALLVPLPALSSPAEAQVVSRVEQRLPGWQIERTAQSWEGAWTVVARCGDRRLGFQMVPGHGLRPGDAWIHPQDQYSWSRLEAVSDDRTYLVWFRDAAQAPSLSCRSELARLSAERRSARVAD